MILEELISQCIKNDRKAQETLYNLYKAKLFPVCLKYCRSQSEAQDHLHDSFIIIFEAIKKFNGKGSFEGWMKRIVINKAIDNYKKNKSYSIEKQKEINLSEDITIDEEELPPTWEALMLLIQELPNQYRIIFNLYEIDEYTHKEISAMLNISENTSKSNLHRAKAILKEKILAKSNNGDFKSDNHGT